MRFVTSSAASLVLACALLTSASAQESITDKLGGWLFGRSPPPPAGNNPGAPVEDIDCPGVSVRQGASTLSISQPGVEATPMTTRYQVSIGQTARECAALGGVLTMKVGVEGRVLLGPVGGPGTIDIPLRMAVVQEGTVPKTVVSKFYRFAVAIPPGQTNVPFMHVEQDLTFPMPRGADLEAYVVYVGFDPQGLAAKPARPAKKTKHK